MRMMRRAGLLKGKTQVTQTFYLDSFYSAGGIDSNNITSPENACNYYPTGTIPQQYATFSASARSDNISIYYNFNLSSIPQTATILDISCSIFQGIYADYYISAPHGSYSEICNGTTSITNTSSIYITSINQPAFNEKTILFTNLNLENFNKNNIKLHSYLNSGSSAYSYYLAGAKLDVTYEY